MVMLPCTFNNGNSTVPRHIEAKGWIFILRPKYAVVVG